MPNRHPRLILDFRDAAGCYSRVAEQLTAAVDDPAHPFHWPGVATVDGTLPAVRTVVLRRYGTKVRTAVVDSRAA